MFLEIIKNWWFWPAVILYIVFWIFLLGFWKGRKERDRHVRNGFLYDFMSFTGPPTFIIYLSFQIIGYSVLFLLLLLSFVVFLLGLVWEVGSKIGSK